MKNPLFLTVLALSVCLEFSAQIGLTNMSISENNAKYLYSGKTNHLYLNNIDENNEYEVRIGELNLDKEGSAQFSYKVPFLGGNQLDIYENNVLIKSEVFQVKRIADSEVLVGNSITKSATVDQLLDLPAFTLASYDTFIEDEYIQGFTMSILEENGAMKRLFEPTKGANFTTEQIEMIETLQSGDKVEINDFWYGDSEGVSRKKNTFSFSIQ
jgi:hypothetical protein